MESSPSEPSIAQQAIESLREEKRNADSRVRAFMRQMVVGLDTLNPDLHPNSYSEDMLPTLFRNAVEETTPLLLDFLNVAREVASTDNSGAATAIYQSFSPILEHYNHPRGFSGIIYAEIFAYYRFIGHEMFVSFISLLLQEERWEIIDEVLGSGLHVDNSRRGVSDNVDFTVLSQHVAELNPSEPFSHEGYLKERHQSSHFEGYVSIDQFADADYFLFLRTQLHNLRSWQCWSIRLLGSRIPHYLTQSYNSRFAAKLCIGLDIDGPEALRSLPLSQYRKPAERIYVLKRPDLLAGFEPERIGTE